MTAIDDRRTIPAAPDDEFPANATPRAAGFVRKGWHVQVAGRFLLVVDVVVGRETIAIFFPDGAFTTARHRAPLWTRDAAEQIAHISALLPARDHYRPTGPIVTPFGGTDDDH